MRFTSGLLRAAQLHPEAIATITGDRRTTFGQQLERVRRLAGALGRLRFRPGDRIAILGANADRYLEIGLALAWGGFVAVPVDTGTAPAAIAAVLRATESVALFVDDAFVAQADPLLDECMMVRCAVTFGTLPAPDGVLSMETLIAQAEPVDEHPASAREPFAIFHAGSDASAPGAALSHEALSLAAQQLLAEGIAPADSVGLHGAPLSAPLAAVFATALLLRGSAQVLVDTAAPAAVAAAGARHAASDALLSDAMLHAPAAAEQTTATAAGAPSRLLYRLTATSAEAIAAWQQRWPAAALHGLYVPTDSVAIATILRPADHADTVRRRSAGRPLLYRRIGIADAQGARLSPGQTGAVIVAGPGLADDGPALPGTAPVRMAHGGLRSGDTGHLDVRGYLFIEGGVASAPPGS